MSAAINEQSANVAMNFAIFIVSSFYGEKCGRFDPSFTSRDVLSSSMMLSTSATVEELIQDAVAKFLEERQRGNRD